MINLSTDKALDVIVEITPYISDIINDDDLRKLIDNNKGKELTKKDTINFYSAVVPILLKKHRSAVYVILAGIQDVNLKTMEKQNFLITMKQIKEIAKDKDLIDFFQSFAPQGSEVEESTTQA